MSESPRRSLYGEITVSRAPLRGSDPKGTHAGHPGAPAVWPGSVAKGSRRHPIGPTCSMVGAGLSCPLTPSQMARRSKRSQSRHHVHVREGLSKGESVAAPLHRKRVREREKRFSYLFLFTP